MTEHNTTETKPASNRTRNGRLVGAATALALLAAACGSNGGPADVATDVVQQPAAATDAAPAPAQPAGTAVSALLGTNSLGEIMVGADGRTLYGFTNDTEAKSTCYGGCAEAWPPVLVDSAWDIGPGLDLGIFATTVRDDGQLQLVAGKWPLYFYTGDAVPGDTNGQGSGDVWFAIDTEGTLILDDSANDDSAADSTADEAAAPAAPVVQTADTALGTILVDEGGLTLYGFTDDTDGVPTCDGACAEAWPPVIVDALPADLDPEVFSVATRTDGQLQLVAGVWPLYRFAGDAAPGDVNGQGSGNVWFAAAPDGGLITSAMSAESGSSAGTTDQPTAEEPAEDDGY